MDKDDAIAKLESLIKEGESVLATSHHIEGVLGAPYVNSELYSPWRAKASIALHELLPESQQDAMKDLEKKANDHTGIARQWQGLLQGTLKGIQQGFIVLERSDDDAADNVIEQILNRFPDVVNSINRRHANRDGYEITDEYDVQDLLRSICLAYFDDIRDEEAVPSFAGKNSRIDLFLKEEARFIEVKMTRDGLRDKRLGEELSIDIPRYKEHPGCERLFCFIYDPGRLVRNPTGLKRDLEKIIPGFVTVIIAR
ncbi:hypothetical protein K6V98_02880 [Collinsella sp. AGMB00827]|uniref:Protein NO VEIN C-terminal domain-containing protein n=1 Tax=Collinsella ureilytica TaxID=2869515 RepID=A0ABS7MIW0_9ACTN|nr:hypothetical protein [Collinsella urealyticum]MBY4797310.1 hypothetical protein [Collinsella urealyticum]